MERRKHVRMVLVDPMACSCSIGDDEPLDGLVRNVGEMGVMIELSGFTDGLMVECPQPVVIDEATGENSGLFSNKAGTLSWVYKNTIGIAFATPLGSNHEELVRWLETHGHHLEGEV